jgi:glutaredoxin
MYDLYTKDNCTFCTKAKALLEEKNIMYREFIVGVNVTREEVLRKFPDQTMVPIIVADNGVTIGGYDKLYERLVTNGAKLLQG